MVQEPLLDLILQSDYPKEVSHRQAATWQTWHSAFCLGVKAAFVLGLHSGADLVCFAFLWITSGIYDKQPGNLRICCIG